jgi:phospholipase/carboxylesterase
MLDHRTVLDRFRALRQGKSISTTLDHYVFFPESSVGNHATIVALHGRGADAHDLIPLIDALALDDTLVVAPRAPMELNLGLGRGFAWYELGQEGIPDARTFLPSLERLRKFLVDIRAGYRVDPDRLILFGFSQGTVMAYAVGLTDPASFSGIVALSGYIPTKSGLQLQLDKLNGFPVFVSHGTHDEIISVEFGREAAELLKRVGANVVYREYSMGHQVSEETLGDLSDWIKKTLFKQKASIDKGA